MLPQKESQKEAKKVSITVLVIVIVAILIVFSLIIVGIVNHYENQLPNTPQENSNLSVNTTQEMDFEGEETITEYQEDNQEIID